MREDQLRSFAYENITVADSANRLTPSTFIATPPTRQVRIFVESAQVRYRNDGTDPTSTVGEILNPNDRLTIDNMSEAESFRIIRTGGSSATLRVHYLR